jgi:hypothetical protein
MIQKTGFRGVLVMKTISPKDTLCERFLARGHTISASLDMYKHEERVQRGSHRIPASSNHVAYAFFPIRPGSTVVRERSNGEHLIGDALSTIKIRTRNNKS